jgi:hypothetical protein
MASEPPTGELLLAYQFSTSPNPLRASDPGLDPERVALMVMVSNPRAAAAPVRGTRIAFLTGGSGEAYLSSAASLGDPQVSVGTDAWTATQEGGTVTLHAGGDAVTEAVVFSLTGDKGQGIPVDAHPGTVSVTVTEFYADGSNSDPAALTTLVKWQNDTVITDFEAADPILYESGETTLLTFAVAQSGAGLGYQVRTGDDWLAGECAADGKCLTAADGVPPGVSTGPLAEDTTFWLDAIERSGSGGAPSLRASVPTKVRVEAPDVKGDSAVVAQPGPVPHLFRVHYYAPNAVRCSLEWCGDVVTAAAPADTADGEGLLVALPRPGTGQPKVTAYAEIGPATAPGWLQEATVPAPGVIATDVNFWAPQRAGLLVSANGGLAAATQQVAQGGMTFAPTAAETDPVGLPTQQPGAFALAPDGSGFRMIGDNHADGNTYFLGESEQYNYTAGDFEAAVYSADGSDLFAAGASGVVRCGADLSGDWTAISSDGLPGAVLMQATADAAALVVLQGGGTVSVLDLPGATLRHAIAVGSSPFDLSLAGPDRALVIDDANLYDVDLAGGAVSATYPLGPSLTGVASVPGTDYALVSSHAVGGVLVVDLAAKAVVPGWIAAPGAMAVRMAGPGMVLVLTDAPNVLRFPA